MQSLEPIVSPRRRCRCSARFGVWALAMVAAIGVANPRLAWADSDKTAPKRPVALFVDVAEAQVPGARDLKPKQLDVHGLPVVLGSAPSNEIGVRAGRRLAFGGGFSVDSTASVSRSAEPGAILSTRGRNAMTVGTTAQFQQSGWDIALFPEISTARLAADPLPDYVIGGRVARSNSGGWELAATSRYKSGAR